MGGTWEKRETSQGYDCVDDTRGHVVGKLGALESTAVAMGREGRRAVGGRVVSDWRVGAGVAAGKGPRAEGAEGKEGGGIGGELVTSLAAAGGREEGEAEEEQRRREELERRCCGH